MKTLLSLLFLSAAAHAADLPSLPDGGLDSRPYAEIAGDIAANLCGARWEDIKGAEQARCWVKANNAALQSYQRTTEAGAECDTDTTCYKIFDKPAIAAAKKAIKHAATAAKE